MASTIPSSTVFSQHSARIEQLLDKNITHFLPEISPVWSSLIKTSQGVESADKFGRDFKIIKTFHGGLAGVLQMAGAKNEYTLYGDNQIQDLGPKLYKQSVATTFPDPTRGMRPSPYQLGIIMRAMEGNIMFTLGEMQLESMPALVGTIIEPQLRGFARNIAQQLSTYWYVSQNDYYQLAKLGSASNVPTIVTVAGVDECEFYPDNEAVNRFQVGQLVNVYDPTGATLKSANLTSASTGDVVATSNESYGDFVVTYVDALRNIVRIRDVNNGELTINDSGDAAGLDTGDIVVFAKSKGVSTTPYSAASPWFTGIAGINSWFKYSGGSTDNEKYLLGAERDQSFQIDCSVHPEFASFRKNASGQTLTEQLLKRWTRRFHAAHKKYGNYLDTFITSDGVVDAYEDARIGRERYDRTNRTRGLSAEGTSGNELNGIGLTFMCDGKEYPVYVDAHVEDGTMYGFRRNDNWKMYVPPDYKGLRPFDRDEVGSALRFVAPALTGTDSIQMPLYSNSGSLALPTEGTQMPCLLRCQLVPENQVCGMKITNLATDRQYSD